MVVNTFFSSVITNERDGYDKQQENYSNYGLDEREGPVSFFSLTYYVTIFGREEMEGEYTCALSFYAHGNENLCPGVRRSHFLMHLEA